MEKIFNKIKAIAKILIGVILVGIIGSFISIIVVLITRAGVLSLALGTLIMIGSVALGAFLGGRWARVNVIRLGSARGIAIGSVAIYFIASFMMLSASSLVSAMLGDAKNNLWIEVAQIFAQSFAIYIALHLAMKQPLLKKEIIG